MMFVRCWCVVLLLLPVVVVRADEAPVAAVKSPVEPRESVQYFESDPGLWVELVACEPQVVDPVAMAFDEFGRLWVAEMTDYPNGPAEGEAPKSQIKILRDTDGDGFYETATVFADKLLFCNGVLPYREGVIVTMSGQIAYLKDTDGDDKSDVFETWFTGFAEENPQLRANHPTFGLDGWVYVSNGLRGGKVIAAKPEWTQNAEPLDISRSDFRFHPETGKYEAITGAGQFGLSFDDWGNRFTCSNRNPCMHMILEQRDIAQNPLARIAELKHDVSPAAEFSRVYSITQAWTTSTLHAGQFTAACGVTIYRGDGLPVDYYGNSFTCEPTGSLVHRDVLTPSGATYSSHYPRKEAEFLASRDSWFRPVNLAHGPDGGLYVCDMYRAVIEHPQFMPEELKNRPDLTLGNDRGRIYRVRTKTDTPTPTTRDAYLADRSSEQLISLLPHANAWQRETAMRLLGERGNRNVVPRLVALMNSGEPRTAVAAFWLLKRMDAVDDSLREWILTTGSPQLATQLLLAEPDTLSQDAKWLPLIEPLSQHDDGALRFRLALFAGTLGDSPERTSTLWTLAQKGNADRWLRDAILIAAHNEPEMILHSMFVDVPEAEIGSRRQLIYGLAEQIGQKHLPEQIDAALKLLASDGQIELRTSLLQGLSQGLRRGGKSLVQLLQDQPEAVHTAAGAILVAAKDHVLSAEVDPTARIEALDLLQFAPQELSEPVFAQLAVSEPHVPLRQRAIELWSAKSDVAIAETLLTDFSRQTPAIRATILTSLAQNRALVPKLLDALEQKQIAVTELNPAQQRVLRNHSQPELKERIAALLANTGAADRKAVIEKYQTALVLKADAQRGRGIFQKNCISCHKIGDLGVNVAPDIADSRTRTPEALLTDILDPNRAIDNNYFSYTVVLDDGKVLTGIIAADTGTSITLRQAENKTVTLLKDEIEEMKSDGVSLMPVGLEKNITEQDMADLISFIKNWRYLDGAVPVGGK